MSLEIWLRNGWLKAEETTLPEIQRLFQVVDRELSDARAQALSSDGKFQHAYIAALQLCVIPLRASGYKVPKGYSHHKRGIESLPLTLGKDWSDVADYLDRCSRNRGQAVYETVGVVSEEDAIDLVNAALELRTDVIKWLTENHAALVPPELMPKE